MPLQLLPMEESDIPAHENIKAAAFGPDLLSCMYPNGYSEEDRVVSIRNTRKGWNKHTGDKGDYKYLKVIDTALPDDDPNNKIVGTAKWQIYLKERTEAELDRESKEGEDQQRGPGANDAMLDAFFAELTESRRENLSGRPHVLLSLLATHPKHHRRGVGAIHVEWGVNLADELGLPAYLEASPKGRPLYARYGFKEIGKMSFDARQWGKEEDVPHYYMLRPAKS